MPTRTLTTLVHLLDSIGDDYLRPGDPTTRPAESLADRAHDAMRPADPTADSALDPARLALADARTDALALLRTLASFPPSLRLRAIASAEDRLTDRLIRLQSAWANWRGRSV